MAAHKKKPRRVVQCIGCGEKHIEYEGENINSSPCCDRALRLCPGELK